MKRIWLCALLGLAISIPVAFAQNDPIPGDIDKDGDVDFADFVQLARNFGRSGPPPSPPEPIRVVVRDTVTVRDTIFVEGATERLESSDWQTIFSRERSNVYWLGIGTDDSRYSWVFIGTGFAVGYQIICTNVHVIDALISAAEKIRGNGISHTIVAIPADGTGRDAIPLAIGTETNELLGFWHPNYTGVSSPDVALVFPETSLPSFSRLVGDRNAMELEVGQEVSTMGYPGELSVDYDPLTRPIPTSKTGTISALRPYDASTPSRLHFGLISNKVVQYDFNTTPGTSGSPVFNKRGEVVAVHNSGFESGSLSFGIRADEVRDLVRAIYVQLGSEVFTPEELVNASKIAIPSLNGGAGN